MLELVSKNCKDPLKPWRDVCIDESMVPIRGRIKFCQYAPCKTKVQKTDILKVVTQSVLKSLSSLLSS
ncbi:hypothetical protein KIN20_018814 [Parelaphostrongylus tenuis]|uniref:PiggyBac transposable element-derived protein domain-containing protein n=1 Tax=Parelaphostrongylus tenuis TaxID=148309 RepID=A0AAD5N1K0_PARTN|nr:hypothetical protein KIN20_018814 [Parelaphostrongylus tenuis]